MRIGSQQSVQQYRASYRPKKQSTLVLRWRDESQVEYIFMPCDDDFVNTAEHQWWPRTNQPADVLDNIHNINLHYERRICEVPEHVRGPLLEYASVPQCLYGSTKLGDVQTCLDNYSGGIDMEFPGVGESWEVIAFLDHITGSDHDRVAVVANDDQANHRKCIISFQGSDDMFGDLSNFLLGNADPTKYCGRNGVHTGVRNELEHIIADYQYHNVIKPALETCHEVICVGHSLGGSLCNLFTMCANQVEDNIGNGDHAGKRAKKSILV